MTTRAPAPWVVGLVAAGLMVLGGLGPWATVLDVASVNGTEGDGWFLIGGGVVLGAALLAWRRRARRRLPALGIAAGVVGALVAFYDLSTIDDLADGTGGFGGNLVETGWGLYVSVLGSLLAVVACVLLLRMTRAVAPPVAPE